ncbi:MAG: MOSC domain-containing protein [Gemmatimonadota bacterium]|nr:MOSC domain-containing protein [Gemmatimonadota bacterium]MDH4352063.1 MOSC domain-containing protein [Gemmatimonadota bacterium]MDH5196196.1 MOSC domain-containing protein [Gemmatimonadota bacterium]
MAAGQLAAIWVKRFKRGPMDSTARATLVAGEGIKGNADQGGKRQVTIISGEVFDALRDELGPALDPSMRRANLMVRGITLGTIRGRTLVVGSVRILVHGETRPCELMDENLPGLRAALGPDWRGGVYGEVLDDGEIGVGDAVRWLPEDV